MPSKLLDQHFEQFKWGGELERVRGGEWEGVSGRGLQHHWSLILHNMCGREGGGYHERIGTNKQRHTGCVQVPR